MVRSNRFSPGALVPGVAVHPTFPRHPFVGGSSILSELRLNRFAVSLLPAVSRDWYAQLRCYESGSQHGPYKLGASTCNRQKRRCRIERLACEKKRTLELPTETRCFSSENNQGGSLDSLSCGFLNGEVFSRDPSSLLTPLPHLRGSEKFSGENYTVAQTSARSGCLVTHVFVSSLPLPVVTGPDESSPSLSAGPVTVASYHLPPKPSGLFIQVTMCVHEARPAVFLQRFVLIFPEVRLASTTGDRSSFRCVVASCPS